MTACVTPKRDRVSLVWGLFAQIQLYSRSQKCVHIVVAVVLHWRAMAMTRRVHVPKNDKGKSVFMP